MSVASNLLNNQFPDSLLHIVRRNIVMSISDCNHDNSCQIYHHDSSNSINNFGLECFPWKRQTTWKLGESNVSSANQNNAHNGTTKITATATATPTEMDSSHTCMSMSYQDRYHESNPFITHDKPIYESKTQSQCQRDKVLSNLTHQTNATAQHKKSGKDNRSVSHNHGQINHKVVMIPSASKELASKSKAISITSKSELGSSCNKQSQEPIIFDSNPLQHPQMDKAPFPNELDCGIPPTNGEISLLSEESSIKSWNDSFDQIEIARVLAQDQFLHNSDSLFSSWSSDECNRNSLVRSLPDKHECYVSTLSDEELRNGTHSEKGDCIHPFCKPLIGSHSSVWFGIGDNNNAVIELAVECSDRINEGEPSDIPKFVQWSQDLGTNERAPSIHETMRILSSQSSIDSTNPQHEEVSCDPNSNPCHINEEHDECIMDDSSNCERSSCSQHRMNTELCDGNSKAGDITEEHDECIFDEGHHCVTPLKVSWTPGGSDQANNVSKDQGSTSKFEQSPSMTTRVFGARDYVEIVTESETRCCLNKDFRSRDSKGSVVDCNRDTISAMHVCPGIDDKGVKSNEGKTMQRRPNPQSSYNGDYGLDFEERRIRLNCTALMKGAKRMIRYQGSLEACKQLVEELRKEQHSRHALRDADSASRLKLLQLSTPTIYVALNEGKFMERLSQARLRRALTLSNEVKRVVSLVSTQNSRYECIEKDLVFRSAFVYTLSRLSFPESTKMKVDRNTKLQHQRKVIMSLLREQTRGRYLIGRTKRFMGS